MGAMKQVLVVRSDLGMGKGKIAAQASHASLEASERSVREKRDWYDAWKSEGQAKIVLKVGGQGELEEVYRKAVTMRLPSAMIHDAGGTQLEPGTATCVGIGPAPEELIDQITGQLKLL